MNSLGSLSKYIDRKIAVVILLLLVAAVVGNFVLLGGAQSQKADILAEYSEKEQSISGLERQVTAIRQGGSADLEALARKVGTIESVLPPESDMITVTAQAAALAAAAGVSLLDFEPNSKAAEGQKLTTGSLEQGIMHATPYSFEVVGSPDGVQKFVEAAMQSEKWLATVESITVVPKTIDGQRAKEDATVFGSSVSGRGIMLVWGLLEPPVVHSPAQAGAPAPAASGTAPTTPAAPAATPTAPAVPAAPASGAAVPAPDAASPAPAVATPAVSSSAAASGPAASPAP